MPARTTRSTSLKSSTNNTQKATNKASSSKSKKLSPELVFEESDDDQESAVHGDSEEYNGEEDDVESLHSDALDDEDEPVENARKRKRGSHPSAKAKTKSSSSKKSPRKKRKTDEDEDAELDFDLEDGQEVVGAIVRAPTTGRVPPGQISQNTLDFLTQLKNPECNDREWFKLHEPVYRLAEEEWKAFIEEFTDVLAEADPQIPHLPPKDVTHRIYRDVRFSNDKTPYKTGLSASFSRSGRKGIFAGYHV
ncbi:hypothetical protein EW026_g6360 [Hermanssonia centrifuga]|uniref:Uncharacterized protein n=1 Tax=Hermanssonia centrifuga TaxID=98765 RepID=A0A4S4KBJ3_9APHY|nr:hypothetical protein EW026_g6360 [Hermanssonia centrifuga]